MKSCLQSIGVWKSVVDRYTPLKKVKSAAQKEEKRNNALSLEIIQKNLSKAIKNKMKTTTSTKELWLNLEHIYKENDMDDEIELIKMLIEDMTDDIKKQVDKVKSPEDFEELIFKLQ